MNNRSIHLIGLLAALTMAAASDSSNIPLQGVWRFALDAQNQGLAEKWFERSLGRSIQLPGALQNQGYGHDVRIDTRFTGDVNKQIWLTKPEYEKHRQPENLKIPFFLQPDKTYVGPAWYQREILIPKEWQNKRVVLMMERAHWETQAWLDGKPLGTNDSLSTPHAFVLGTQLKPGIHVLTLRVDNRLVVDVGSWAHSVSDQTQGNWNGIIGRMELSATPLVWIEDVQVYPDVKTRSVQVRGRIGKTSSQQTSSGVILEVEAVGATASKTTKRTATVQVEGEEFTTQINLGDKALLWDEFAPNLYRLTARSDDGALHKSVIFGLREISVMNDRMLSLNGRPIFLRGTLECCIFPKTGYPPMDVDSWKKIIRTCQAHGLNHMRFHSWCPPEAAFEAADELGFYYHVECAAWAQIGSGKPVDAWLYAEGERIVRAYGNHPSFIMMAYGNEPNGPRHKEWLSEWVSYWKKKDARRLYTSGAGWPLIDENQYHVTPAPRGQKGWIGKDYRNDVQTGRSRRDSVQAIDVPVVVHEMGQWCVYPNFDEIAKYTGPLKPKNFEIFRESLADHGMLDQWRDFLKASGKLQALCYKEEVEAAFRTPGIGGVQLLDLHDFPGQGTALVGILDAFWESKGYISAREFKRFYSETVPLARMTKRVWTTSERFTADVEAAHFGPAPIERAKMQWQLRNSNGATVAKGFLPPSTLAIGRNTGLGRIELSLSRIPAPEKYRLVLGINGTSYENDWTVYLYPDKADSIQQTNVMIAREFNETVIQRLQSGGKVLLQLAKLSAAHPPNSFTPIFWNRYMFNTQRTSTLGLLCDPKHPALREFPTDFHSDWQWEELLSRSQSMVLDGLPQKLRPIVQIIDDWNTNRKLGFVFEVAIGRGKLLVCCADLEKNLDARPVARQLRESLLGYMKSPQFSPAVSVTEEAFREVLQPRQSSNMAKLEATVIQTDSEDKENGNVAANAIDGNPDTFWHTRWQPANDPMPHFIIVDLGREVALTGLTYQPRMDMANGRISEAEIYCSLSNGQWNNPVAKAKWRNSDQKQTVRFTKPIRARYVKFQATAEINDNPFASVAELDVILEENQN